MYVADSFGNWSGLTAYLWVFPTHLLCSYRKSFGRLIKQNIIDSMDAKRFGIQAFAITYLFKLFAN